LNSFNIKLYFYYTPFFGKNQAFLYKKVRQCKIIAKPANPCYYWIVPNFYLNFIDRRNIDGLFRLKMPFLGVFSPKSTSVKCPQAL